MVYRPRQSGPDPSPTDRGRLARVLQQRLSGVRPRSAGAVWGFAGELWGWGWRDGYVCPLFFSLFIYLFPSPPPLLLVWAFFLIEMDFRQKYMEGFESCGVVWCDVM